MDFGADAPHHFFAEDSATRRARDAEPWHAPDLVEIDRTMQTGRMVGVSIERNFARRKCEYRTLFSVNYIGHLQTRMQL